jgi:putative ABC transport system substrate-binding protein
MELLHQIVPSARVFAMLVNPGNPNAEPEHAEAEIAAQKLGLRLVYLKAGTEDEIDAAFASAVQQGAGAVFVASDAALTFLLSQRGRIAGLMARHRIPTSFSNRETVVAGGLMSYGTRFEDSYRLAGVYAGRILKGEKPSELPVMQPTAFALVINLKTAQALGIEISRDILLIADEVVE